MLNAVCDQKCKRNFVVVAVCAFFFSLSLLSYFFLVFGLAANDSEMNRLNAVRCNTNSEHKM